MPPPPGADATADRHLDPRAVRDLLGSAGRPWGRVGVHATIDSTNAEALRDPRAWSVVVAEHQSAGRGRRSRTWQAPPGTSLAITAVLPVPRHRTEALGWVPLLAGMAMGRALQDVARVRTGLKWPNDVLAAAGPMRERLVWGKVCGVLAQLVQPGPDAPGSHGGPGGALVVLGAGVNLTQRRDQLPVPTATSVRLCRTGSARPDGQAGGDPDPVALLVAYLDRVAALHARWGGTDDELAGVRADYRRHCSTIGQEVRVHHPDDTVTEGLATGVDDDGHLLVRSGGRETVHVAGDVVHLRPAGTATLPGAPGV